MTLTRKKATNPVPRYSELLSNRIHIRPAFTQSAGFLLKALIF